MDYNSIDDDDVEKLRLAALMSFKRKSNVPINTISSTSAEFCQNKFATGNSFNNSSRNRGRFPVSNRPYNKRTYPNLTFRRSSHANNNLIAIIPTDGESDPHANDLVSNNSPKPTNSKILTNDGTKTNDVHNLNDEVSTKFSRLDNDSGSEESEDSETERDGQEESDDGDVLSLGEKDEDLDDLDKLMDIMEAEINGEDVKPSKKVKKSIKQNNKNKKEKSTELKIKNKLTVKVDEPTVINPPKVVNNLAPLVNPPEEELESIKTLEEIRNSPAQCILLNSRVPLKSPSPRNRKKSISPYSKLRKRSPSRSPRRRSPTPDRYRYSPLRSRPYRRSISPRRSPRRLSPLREKNLSPRRYSPLKSRYPYRSPSPRRSRRSLSRDISPKRRRLSPLRRRSRSPLKIKSKSRSPKIRTAVRRRSPSPLKKVIKSRPVSPNIRRKDNKILDDEYLKKKEKIKPVDKQIESRSIDPVLEARKRKFESNKLVEPSSKKIILRKTNSVQVAIQTENKEMQNKKNEPEIKPKTMQLTKKSNKISQSFPIPKSISNEMKKDLEVIKLQRTVKLNNSPEKIKDKKRPRIVFGHDDTNDLLIDQEGRLNCHKEKKNKTMVVESETLEVSSASGEESESSVEEMSEENEEDGSEKEAGQKSSDGDEEYIEEEDEDEDEEDEGIQERQQIDDKKVTIQHNDLVDLRTELKRRRALRLNTIQVEVKKKPESFYPARLLQSAIRGVVGSSGSNEVKRKKHSKIPEISIKTEGNLDGRRVIVMNRDSKTRSDLSILLPEGQEVYDSEEESYTNVKKQKAKLKKVPLHSRKVVNSGNTIQKGFKKIKKRNINVTDFDQVFDVLITCIFSYWSTYMPTILFQIHTIFLSFKICLYCSLVLNHNKLIKLQFIFCNIVTY
ncbi:serine/arginine repetitive matrix protein 1-like isoform X2 [Sipha flava]|uniref:Serine/arginine repetitive matrix protein 1-like isoform X2 n=1 Tax=Sipha flava TaxID=143950 RepID=A0A8B8FLY3_9HEMI|nr:serine/arginine repetitive matrix protein 1-like isoform X2 [Sipha flava]